MFSDFDLLSVRWRLSDTLLIHFFGITMNLTRDEIRVMIYYDYKKQLSQEECLESLHKTFGDSCVSRTTVYRWFAEIEDILQIGSAATEPILHEYVVRVRV